MTKDKVSSLMWFFLKENMEIAEHGNYLRNLSKVRDKEMQKIIFNNRGEVVNLAYIIPSTKSKTGYPAFLYFEE